MVLIRITGFQGKYSTAVTERQLTIRYTEV